VKTYDWQIIGAGFVGATIAERIAAQLNQRVLLVDRRDHVGGNAYDRVNEHGHLIHQYGPHIFHTNAAPIATYLSRFTEWLDYEHRVLGLIDGRLVPIPFNLTSIDILFPPAEAASLKDTLIATYGMDQKVPILTLKQSPDAAIAALAGFIYDNVFDGYTRKQWGIGPEELSPSVTGRVPVHISYDDRYFQDKFQKMPRLGYSHLFENMLRHDNIEVALETTIPNRDLIASASKVLYTGAIDEFFDYCFGPLEYRSLSFDFRTYQQGRHQAVGQVNYPVSGDYTRITEFAQLTGQSDSSTTVAIEFPKPHIPGETVPYYPVPRDINKTLYAKYKDLAATAAPHVLFAGRLADYQYYNMDQAVGRGLSVFEKEIAGR
jgi:UDP-galactopyranose mutase